MPDLEEEQLREMITDRKEEAGGLLTDEGAAHIIAYELGVTLRREEEIGTEIHIEDLSIGMNDISISGRVLLLGLTYLFTKQDGTEGKVKKMLLGDRTKVVNVSVWDDKVDTLLEDIQPNIMVRISHGYVREGLDGDPELHIGSRGSIVKIRDVKTEDYPRVEDYYLRIGEIREDIKFLHIQGKVKQIYPCSEFTYSDGKEGKVQRILLSDDTGEIIVVFWGETTDKIRELEIDSQIRINTLLVRKNQGKIEVHTTDQTKIEIVKSSEEEDERSRNELTISNLEPRMTSVDLLARIVQIGNIRNFETKSGRSGKVVTILLKDNTGKIRLNLWNDMVKRTSTIKRNDLVSIENAYVRSWFDTLSLNLGSKGEIRVIQGNKSKIPGLSHKFDRIVDIKETRDFVSLKGEITKEPQVKDVTTKRQSKVKVATFSIRDDTGEIDVTLWGELADSAEKLERGTEVIIHGAWVDKRGGEVRVKSNVLTTIEFS